MSFQEIYKSAVETVKEASSKVASKVKDAYKSPSEIYQNIRDKVAKGAVALGLAGLALLGPGYKGKSEGYQLRIDFLELEKSFYEERAGPDYVEFLEVDYGIGLICIGDDCKGLTSFEVVIPYDYGSMWFGSASRNYSIKVGAGSAEFDSTAKKINVSNINWYVDRNNNVFSMHAPITYVFPVKDENGDPVVIPGQKPFTISLNGTVYYDDIKMYLTEEMQEEGASPVPEPSAASLLILGGAPLAYLLRKRNKQ